MKPFPMIVITLLAAGGVQAAPAPANLRLTHRQALQLGATNLLQARIAPAAQRNDACFNPAGRAEQAVRSRSNQLAKFARLRLPAQDRHQRGAVDHHQAGRPCSS